jgi:hypothetical protein
MCAVSQAVSAATCRGPGRVPGPGGRPWPCLRGQSAATNLPGESGGCWGGLSRTTARVFAALRKEAFVRYVVACRAGQYRRRAERSFWAYPVSCVSACDPDGNPARRREPGRPLFQVVMFVIIGSCPSLPADGCGVGVVLLTGRPSCRRPVSSSARATGRYRQRAARASCASSWRCRSSTAEEGD